MEIITNPERGCGHLKNDSMYLRAEPGAMGILPAFVQFMNPIPYDDKFFRTWKKFPGLLWDLINQYSTIPHEEVFEYLARIQNKKDLDKIISIGYDLSAQTFDLLMWVGESYYPSPQDFIDECMKHGICKRIKKGDVPAIMPGFTRLFIIHPHGLGKNCPAIIGYSYLTRAVYTQPSKKAIPKWVQDLSDVGQLVIVKVAGKTTSGTRTRMIDESEDEEC